MLTYWVEVQKTRDGKDYEDPFRLASENIIFERNYRARLHVSSRQAGYLYMVNEGPVPQGDRPKYVLIFPVPSQNAGSARLSEGQSVLVPEKSWMKFDDEKGPEKLWLVFSEQAVPELEAVKGVLNPTDMGQIKDPAQVSAVESYLSRHKTPAPQVTVDDESKQTIIRGVGDPVVSVRKFEHY